jgi:hypothetical protein
MRKLPSDAAAQNLDQRFYTQAEVAALLAGKSGVGHTHDDRYYTQAEVDGLLEGIEVGGGTPALVLDAPPVDGVGGVAQVETYTAASGSFIAGGTMTVTVTSAAITGSPLAIAVEVGAGTPSTWGPLVRAALAASSAVTERFTVSGAGLETILTAKALDGVFPANDPTLNIGTSGPFGHSNPTSVNTTEGVATTVGTVPAAPGQIGIYAGTVAGQPVTVSFRALSVSPARWEAATPGLFRDPDVPGGWLLQTIGAGLEIDFKPLI